MLNYVSLSSFLLLLCISTGALADADERFLKYGDDILLQNNWEDFNWMTGCRSTTDHKNVYVRNLKGSDYEAGLESTYKWKIQSQSSGADPKAGECLKYGDKIYLQNRYRDDRWLSGSRGSGNTGVITFDNRSSYEGTTVGKTYEWIVRSNVGSGYRTNEKSPDPAYGNCVEEHSLVALQNNYIDNRWLSGDRGGDSSVIAQNFLKSSYERNTVRNTYGWIMKRSIGSGSRTEKLQCAAVGAHGYWKPLKYSNEMQTIRYTEGVSLTSESSIERTSFWETSVTASVSAGFSFGSASLEVSAAYGESYTEVVSEAVEQFQEREFTSSFGKGQVWQFNYDITDICQSEFSIVTADLVVTDNATEPPCCLPGYALGKEHGPCAAGSPCSCSPEICNADPEEPTNCGGERRNLRG